jgi:ATPase family associated with various cellular activities (AAA)
LAEELKSYTRDLLLERSSGFCKSIATLLEQSKPNFDIEEVTTTLRTLLQYRGAYLSSGIQKLREISSTAAHISTQGIKSDHYPNSAPWTKYSVKSVNVKSRLKNYRKACSDARNREKLKPFVLLVVGEPGTGKSKFVESVVKSGWSPAVEITVDLSQATSLSAQLESAWKQLYLSRKGDEVSLLILEEFDSQVGERVEQYRQVLRPLWDAQSYVHDLGTITLGPYVAVCIMSKISNFAAARRLLARSDKGLDFLSRVDVVVEIPSFDRPATQLELVTTLLAQRFVGKPSAKISQLALWFLSWVDSGDNFRAITKALKTVSETANYIGFADLNLDPNLRRDFEILLLEFAQTDELTFEKFQEQDEEHWASSFERSGDVIKLIHSRPLTDAFKQEQGSPNPNHVS